MEDNIAKLDSDGEDSEQQGLRFESKAIHRSTSANLPCRFLS